MADRDLSKMEDEDELHALMKATEDFNRRRQIRARLKEIHEAKEAEFAKKRSEGGGGTDVVALRQKQAAEAKARKLKALEESAQQKRDKKGDSREEYIRQKHAEADKEKQQKLEKMKEMGAVMSSVYAAGTDIRDEVEKTAASKRGTKEEGSATTTKTETGADGSKRTTTTSVTTSKTKGDAAAGGEGKVSLQRSPSGIKDMLIAWCAAKTKGYAHVNITNFSSSWNDGMAFCALIHHFYPRAFDYSKLQPKFRKGNFKLAFTVSEKLGDIAPLLDVEDMVRMKNPDWKCVFTYVQQFYRKFHDWDEQQAAKAAEGSA